MMIKVRELSLASYVKLFGGVLINYENGSFIFESDLTEREWRVLFSNSESQKFDNTVRELRKFLTT